MKESRHCIEATMMDSMMPETSMTLYLWIHFTVYMFLVYFS